jgi:hypothetical protein
MGRTPVSKVSPKNATPLSSSLRAHGGDVVGAQRDRVGVGPELAARGGLAVTSCPRPMR